MMRKFILLFFLIVTSISEIFCEGISLASDSFVFEAYKNKYIEGADEDWEYSVVMIDYTQSDSGFEVFDGELFEIAENRLSSSSHLHLFDVRLVTNSVYYPLTITLSFTPFQKEVQNEESDTFEVVDIIPVNVRIDPSFGFVNEYNQGDITDDKANNYSKNSFENAANGTTTGTRNLNNISTVQSAVFKFSPNGKSAFQRFTPIMWYEEVSKVDNVWPWPDTVYYRPHYADAVYELKAYVSLPEDTDLSSKTGQYIMDVTVMVEAEL